RPLPAVMLVAPPIQRALPTARPPRRRRRRSGIGKRQRPELVQRLHVDRSLEIDDLLDGAPVVDPAAAVELGLGRQIETHAVRVRRELQQEPALLLADAERRPLTANVAIGQAIARPAFRGSDELDVRWRETDL